MVDRGSSEVQGSQALKRSRHVPIKDDDLGTSDINMQPSNQIPLMYDEGKHTHNF